MDQKHAACNPNREIHHAPLHNGIIHILQNFFAIRISPPYKSDAYNFGTTLNKTKGSL